MLKAQHSTLNTQHNYSHCLIPLRLAQRNPFLEKICNREFLWTYSSGMGWILKYWNTGAFMCILAYKLCIVHCTSYFVHSTSFPRVTCTVCIKPWASFHSVADTFHVLFYQPLLMCGGVYIVYVSIVYTHGKWKEKRCGCGTMWEIHNLNSKPFAKVKPNSIRLSILHIHFTHL